MHEVSKQNKCDLLKIKAELKVCNGIIHVSMRRHNIII